MRVAVTGADGRIGRVVVRVLSAESQFEITEVGSPRSASAAVRLDLADPVAVSEFADASDFDAIVHLGGLTGARCAVDEELAERVNVRATALLADAAPTVVFASSAAVYGDDNADQITETQTPRPTSVYGATKARAEDALLQQSTSQVRILRIFNVYGSAFPDSLVTRLALSNAEAPVPLIGWGRFVRDYVRDADVAMSIRAALLHADSPHPVVANVASGLAVSNERLVGILQLTRPVHFAISGDAESRSWAAVDVARDRFGWAAQYPLEAFQP